jgi:hypothetical protein
MRKLSVALVLAFMLSVSLLAGVAEATKGGKGGGSPWSDTGVTCTTNSGTAGALWVDSDTGAEHCRAL